MSDTHSKTMGYVLWLFGFTGAHRFYYGKPKTGTLYFFTLGLFFVGWIIDLFLIPAMDRQADLRFKEGKLIPIRFQFETNYSKTTLCIKKNILIN